jgi:16S rRNA (guanine527-N7)-methyltransferase
MNVLPHAAPDAETRLSALSEATGVPLDAQQRAQLGAYVALLQKWNAVYNLTAVRGVEEIWQLHVADCLAAAPAYAAEQQRLSMLLPDRVSGSMRILDVGSGGGLPAVILAIVYRWARVTACDAVAKKCAFVRQAAGELALERLAVIHARAETLHGEYDIVTSRAFSDLSTFVRLTAHLRAPQGVWLAMKGTPPSQEIEALQAQQPGLAAEVMPLRVPGLAAQRCIVRITHRGAP